MATGAAASLRRRSLEAFERSQVKRAELTAIKRGELVNRARRLLEERLAIREEPTVVDVDIEKSFVQMEVDGIALKVTSYDVLYGRTGERIFSLEGLGRLIARDAKGQLSRRQSSRR